MKLYSENGRLSEDGKKITAQFRDLIIKLLQTGQDANEVRILGSLLSGLLNDITSEEAIKRKA